MLFPPRLIKMIARVSEQITYIQDAYLITHVKGHTLR